MRSKLGLLHVLAVVGSSLLTSAYATGPGFFLGLQAGQTNVHAVPGTFTTSSGQSVSVSPSNNGFGARLFMGYNFTSYAAMEGGATRYSPANYNYSGGSCRNTPKYGFDLVAKGLVPVSVVSVFGKAGIDVLRTAGFKDMFAKNSTSGTSCTGGQAYSTAARPIIGAGVSYDLTPNWVVDLSWTRVLKGGNSQNADFKSIGFAYHFVKLYCGQFLC